MAQYTVGNVAQSNLPVATFEEFKSAIESCIQTFPKNRYCQKLDDKKMTIKDYHRLLNALFHQVFHSSNHFARAASRLEPLRNIPRDYLLKHADEEKSHWIWILDDLKNTGFTGPDPRTVFPRVSTQAYISFNYFLADQMPIARLGIAAMLESLGATYGKEYATRACRHLDLKQNQFTFFLGHGDTDVGHTKEILDTLQKSEPTPREWAWLKYAAETGSELYNRIYDEATAD